MRRTRHGLAVRMVLLSILTATFATPISLGCRPDDERRASGPSIGPAEADGREPLPPPEFRTELLGREPVTVPAELADLRPTALLPAGERTMFYNAMGPLLLRVTRADGSTLAEAEARGGEVLVVDRRTGVKLAGRQLARGPLDEQAAYALYALPSGGVKQEVTRSRVRPETLAEREARRDADEERRRLAQEAAASATRPTSRPSGE